ncbi:uncharacterized protein PV09_07238 [Verruconis gallopava]|uniref:Major facilitator superfamily (MFS) profile domain-containing protein n=1 Tax=Verruconis gallopava TaxID=253628 RepID=A0A0D2A4T5_9PEZI|nr:uncharacterized protein PV09_07238 [Verruconis gallopava]KIW01485.1 hypothetical protein PV09_07238 [Verruconis gallopava]
MGTPEASLRPSSKSSLHGSAESTLAPSGVPSVMEKGDRPAGHPAESAEVKETAVAHTESRQSSQVADRDGGVRTGGDDDKEISEKIEAQKKETGDSSEEEDDTEYPQKWRLALITIALCLSVFCMALDNTIIAVAIPRITDQFKALNDVGWYASAYLLCTCAFQLFFGKLYTFYSVKWTYLSALFIFELGSLICGIAPNSTALIIGRAIAGLGAAGIFSGALLIVAYTVPLRQRPTYMGLVGGMYGIASVAGPLMGGAFTDRLTWRWCFYINLPFGAVTAIFIIIFFSSPKRAKDTATTWRGQVAQMDPLGTVTFMAGVICLLLALQWGGSKYAWGNARIIVLLVLFAVLATCFVAIQIWKQERATVPPRIFKNQNVWGGAIFAAMVGGAFFILVYYLPIWFQAIKGVSAVKSGIMNLPLILGVVVLSILAGGLTTALGYYTPFMYASTVFMAVGAGLITTFKVNTGHSKWIGYQFIFGTGVGLGMQQTMIAAQTVLPKADIAIGTSIMMFSQTLGGALFVSVGQNVFTNELVKGIKHYVPNLDAGFVLSVGATEIKNRVPPASLSGVLQAYNDALTRTWYAAVALACLSGLGCAFVQWKSVKGKKIEPAMA